MRMTCDRCGKDRMLNEAHTPQGDPDITRLIDHIEDWKGQGSALGRAEAARRLEEAHKLLDELAATRRLITTDCGGSNGVRLRL